ncbi:hypothetical protein GCM10027269_59110 [Kribbella endophytica]
MPSHPARMAGQSDASGTQQGVESLAASAAVFDPAPCWHVRAKPRARAGSEAKREREAGGPSPGGGALSGPGGARLEDVEELVR